MIERTLVVLAVFCLTLSASAALPRLVVREYNSSGVTLTTTYNDTAGINSNLTIPLQNGTSRVNIWVDYSDPPESPVAFGHITFTPRTNAIGAT